MPQFHYPTFHSLLLNMCVLKIIRQVSGGQCIYIIDFQTREGGLSEQELLEMYGDFVVEKFDQKPPPYSTATYATPTDPAPSPDDDVITGEKVAKLLAKVRMC